MSAVQISVQMRQVVPGQKPVVLFFLLFEKRAPGREGRRVARRGGVPMFCGCYTAENEVYERRSNACCWLLPGRFGLGGSGGRGSGSETSQECEPKPSLPVSRVQHPLTSSVPGLAGPMSLLLAMGQVYIHAKSRRGWVGMRPRPNLLVFVVFFVFFSHAAHTPNDFYRFLGRRSATEPPLRFVCSNAVVPVASNSNRNVRFLSLETIWGMLMPARCFALRAAVRLVVECVRSAFEGILHCATMPFEGRNREGGGDV